VQKMALALEVFENQQEVDPCWVEDPFLGAPFVVAATMHQQEQQEVRRQAPVELHLEPAASHSDLR